jgi:type III pantothenate kinase
VSEQNFLLAIDIGNTNITFGLWNGQSWVGDWRSRTVQDKMPDEYAVLLRSFLRDDGYQFNQINGVVIASVVPKLTLAYVELCHRHIKVDPVVVTANSLTGIRIDVDNPEQVGADRIVNAAAVQYLYGGPAIVIDFGTATTFDIIAKDGSYIGGSIAPGIGIALDALVGRTAQLYKVTLQPPPSPIGRNTTHAIQSGLFLGYVEMVNGLTRRLQEAMPGKVIATGGLAPLFRDYTTVIDEIAPNLTLDGLRIIHGLNAPSAS